MRRLRLAVIGLLVFLVVARIAVAAPDIDAIARNTGSAASPFLVLAEAGGQSKHSTSTHAVGGTFQNFGHNVANGAKGVGHKVEGGARDFGRSVVQGWESFKRNFTGH